MIVVDTLCLDRIPPRARSAAPGWRLPPVRNLRPDFTGGPTRPADLGASGLFEDRLRSLLRLSDPLPVGLFFQAVDIYREGRRQGHPYVPTTDCLKAAIAIENGAPMWHRGRDYDAIAKYTPLRISG